MYTVSNSDMMRAQSSSMSASSTADLRCAAGHDIRMTQNFFVSMMSANCKVKFSQPCSDLGKARSKPPSSTGGASYPRRWSPAMQAMSPSKVSTMYLPRSSTQPSTWPRCPSTSTRLARGPAL